MAMNMCAPIIPGTCATSMECYICNTQSVLKGCTGRGAAYVRTHGGYWNGNRWYEFRMLCCLRVLVLRKIQMNLIMLTRISNNARTSECVDRLFCHWLMEAWRNAISDRQQYSDCRVHESNNITVILQICRRDWTTKRPPLRASPWIVCWRSLDNQASTLRRFSYRPAQ